MKPSRRTKVKKMLVKKNPATGNATAVGTISKTVKSLAEDEVESGADRAVTHTMSSSRRRLYQPLEFRGVCVQNKAGIFPCPTVGTLLERGASQFFFFPVCRVDGLMCTGLIPFRLHYNSIFLITYPTSASPSSTTFSLPCCAFVILDHEWFTLGHAEQAMYSVKYNGRTPLFETPAPKAVKGRFEFPAWTEPNLGKDMLIYDERLTAGGLQSIYGSLSDPGAPGPVPTC